MFAPADRRAGVNGLCSAFRTDYGGERITGFFSARISHYHRDVVVLGYALPAYFWIREVRA